MPKSEADYRRLIADHPKKFTAEEAGYQAATDAMTCSTCSHYYLNPLHNWRVCEIMRPPDETVKANWTCRFWTLDQGDTLPKLDTE